jgi:hypothetical protein
MQIASDKIFSDANALLRHDLFAGGAQLPEKLIDPVLMDWLVERTPKSEQRG